MYKKKIQNKNLTNNAQVLRKSMTKEEALLWSKCLKELPVTIRRQKVIGKYIVDFCCCEKKLIIELDGSQHYEDEGLQSDIERDAYLTNLGYTVLRFSNYELLKKFDNVKAQIEYYLLEKE